VAAVWKPYVDSLPIPTGAVSANGLTAEQKFVGALPITQDAISLRVDHRLGNRTNVFVRANYSPSTSTTGYDSSRSDTTSHVSTVTAGGSFILGSNTVNDLRVNWSRNRAGRSDYAAPVDGAVAPQESQVLPPGFSFDNARIAGIGVRLPGNSGYVAGIAAMGMFSANVQQQLNVVDTLTWTMGRHTAKSGIDWRRLTPRPAFAPQGMNFTVSWDDLKNGTIGSAYIVGAGANTLRMDNYSLFAQDMWSARNNLTLTYGVRWDVNPAPVSQTSMPLYAVLGVFDTSVPWSVTPATGGLWKTDYSNVAPRLGAAYQLTPKTLLRAGAGVFYDIGAPSALASQAAINFPMYRGGVRMTNTVYSLADPTPFIPPPVTTTPGELGAFVAAFDPNLRTPLTYQWNVGMERQIGRSDTLSVTYIGSRGDSMLRYDSMTNTNLNGAYWQVTAIRNAARSRYNGLQVSYQRRMWHGLQAQASYVLSHSQDTASNDLSTNNGLRAQKLGDINVDYNWGDSSFDVRHVFSGAFSYEIPEPPGTGVVHALFRDWAIDGLLTLRSGLPIDILSVSWAYYGGVQQHLRPDVVPGQAQWIDDSTVAGGRRLNPDAWVAAPNGQPGNAPRNSVRNFGIRNFDFAVRRRFRIAARYTLDLRAEAFNLFNTPNLSVDPLATYVGPAPYAFGVARMTANQYLAGPANNQGGGVSPQYGVGGPRSVQLTLRFGF
jgi:hypothetical protein